jgi:molybdopterin/thiamine biosynthesis adenylyltransferase/nitroreductase
MGNVVGRRYRYGASFVDRLSGVRFEGHHPVLRPDLWKLYLNEAEGIFRAHGFEGTLHRQELEEGNGVSLFFLGFAADGKVVAGVRCHGPLEGSHQAALIEEMATSPEVDDFARLIDAHIAHGAIEIKGAFSKGESVTGHRLVATISRAVTHAMQWLGAEFAIAAVSHTLLKTGHETGARQVGTTSVPFPDERYRTVAVEWYRARSHELCSPSHQLDLRLEAEQLSRRNATAASPIESVATAGAPWRPVVLDMQQRSHREVLQVLREDTSLQILDRYSEQHAQLAELKPAPATSMLDEGQRWVYFPWRRTVVRLLPPKGFTALRLDRNRNKLTRDEQSRLRTLRIGIVGLSAGHSIAHVLAMEGLAGELRLADFDSIELSNLNRLPATVLDLGINKAVVAARRIAEIDPYLRIVSVTEGITPDNLGSFLDGLDLVIEECDSLDVKLLVREAARDRRIPVIMETSDRGVLDVERYDLEPDRPIFHGLLPGVDSTELAGLSIEQKAPIVLRMMGAADVTSRGAASLFEIGRTITAWPQLGGEVTLGAASAAAVVRRFGLKGQLPSGRVHVDLEEVISQLAPVAAPADNPSEPIVAEAPLPEDADSIDRIVDAARRAPSGGNVQPWRFEADDTEIRFYLVPERTTAMDVRFRASYVGIGAAIFNARAAAASFGMLGSVKLFPEGYPSRHVATIRLGEGSDPDISALAGQIQRRAANRHMGQPAAIDAATLHLLTRGVEREGAQLRLLTERPKIDRLGELLAESDRIRFLTPTLHREMFSELRFPGRDAVDQGIDIRTLELGPSELASLELLSRPDVMAHLADWRAGQALGLRSRAGVGTSSAMAAIVVPRADPIAYVRGGAAVERFWLTSEVQGLGVHPVSPIFLYAVDEEERLGLVGDRNIDALADMAHRFNDLFELSDGERVALLLRVLHAAPPTVLSARLPLAHLLSRQRDSTPAMAVVTPLHNGTSAGHGEMRN